MTIRGAINAISAVIDIMASITIRKLPRRRYFICDGNPFPDMASNFAAELQRPTPGLTERRGVGGGLPR